ncbi:MAG: CsgG/HfaB family protein [Elusimicrobiota bacterium]
MQKLVFFLLCIIVSLTGCVTVQTTTTESATEDVLELNLPHYNGPRKIIYVFDLKNSSEFDDPKIGRGMAKMLTTALVDSKRFKVVERSPEMIKSILEEQRFSQSAVVDEQTAARIGKLLGAQAVVVGEVSEFGIRKTGVYTGFTGSRNITTRIVIDAKMVSVETGEIISAATGIGTCTTSSSGTGAVLSFEYGTEGFDETSIGIATRKAIYQLVEKIAMEVERL